ncbi:MAG: class I SAM-dependent methyltransferase [Anaerolineales bacterium]|nr:class I SAM-dependent methyltransferase [Anaerolineales bacterium]
MEQPGNSYIGHHAELYDLFYADKPYAQETDFVIHCFQRYGIQKPKPVILELACGTGNHAFEFEKRGYQVIASDYSPDMLAQARRKALRSHSQVEFRQHDMRSLDVAERPFDAIVCLFDSIGYVATNENILAVLRGVRDHLAPGGLFIFEFWHAAAMLRHYDPLRVRRWKVEAGEILRISETTIDYSSQLGYVAYTVNELNDNGTFRTLHETQINRFFLVQEMKLFLEQAGLHALHWFSGFREDETIDAETWHIVAVAARMDG